jgi:hypothetical protein
MVKDALTSKNKLDFWQGEHRPVAGRFEISDTQRLLGFKIGGQRTTAMSHQGVYQVTL